MEAKCVSPLRQLNLREANIGTVIWATGFSGDFHWIHLPVLDDQKKPIQDAKVVVTGARQGVKYAPVIASVLREVRGPATDYAKSRVEAARQSECEWMLPAEDRPIRVVIEDNKLGAPEQNDLRFRRQQDADRAAQALRPMLKRAERGRGPVLVAHEPAHFAAARQPIRRRRRRAIQYCSHLLSRSC